MLRTWKFQNLSDVFCEQPPAENTRKHDVSRKIVSRQCWINSWDLKNYEIFPSVDVWLLCSEKSRQKRGNRVENKFIFFCWIGQSCGLYGRWAVPVVFEKFKASSSSVWRILWIGFYNHWRNFGYKHWEKTL